MGIFSKKEQKYTDLPKSQAQAISEDVFDDDYREQLKELGKRHFQSLIDKHSDNLSQSIKSLADGLRTELKDYATHQLDLILSKINKDISDKVSEQLADYKHTSNQAQELVTQSLNQSAQAIFAKYQQMIKDLGQTVSEQEVKMAGVFQDNKSRVLELQNEQNIIAKELRDNISTTKRQADELNYDLKTTIANQSHKFTTIYEENIAEIKRVKESQDRAMKTLDESINRVEQQHQQLQQLMTTALEKQKTLIADVINKHMSQIIEHYLVVTLGDNSDIVAQLPAILEKLDGSKQAMQEDMKL